MNISYRHIFLVAFLAVLLSIIVPELLPDSSTSMSEDYSKLREEYKAMNKSAFIVGYTGESGKALMKELFTSGVFSRVVLIGRRQVTYEDELFKNAEQRVIDFDKIDEHKSAFEGFDQGFCCLGTTRKKSGADGFYKVDHDYVVNTGKVAREAGVSHFHLVSSQGANKDAWFLYTKTKGEAEEDLKALNFPKLSIYRPAVLMCDRAEARPTERVAITLLKPVAYMCPTFITTPITVLATAMVNEACRNHTEAVRTLDNRAIHSQGK